MSGEQEEKELRRGVHAGILSSGFFRQGANTQQAINNIQLLIQYLVDHPESAGQHFSFIKRILETGSEAIQRFQRSKERSFNALTLS